MVAPSAVDCDLCGGADAVNRFSLRQRRIVTCAGCGLSFVSPRTDPDIVSSRLQQWAGDDVLDRERLRIAFNPGALRRYHRYLRWIERALRRPGRALLDVGCSTGALLTVARERGWSVQGLEPGEASAKYARLTKELDVRTGSIDEAEIEPGSCDAVVLLEVLEHLASPRRALERLATWVAPGGVLLLSTPNFDSLFRRWHGPGWWVVNCEEEHLHFFTVRSLRNALRACGFDVVTMRVRGFDLVGMIRAARAHPARPGGNGNGAPGYYEHRRAHELWKERLGRAGLLALVWRGVDLFEFLSSTSWSPLYGFGEQLVVVAVRQGGPDRHERKDASQ